MENALLIQAASNIAGGMAGAQYGRFQAIELSKMQDIAVIAVKLARLIEAEAYKQP